MNDELKIRREIDELDAALGIGSYNNKICSEPGCYNHTYAHYTVCVSCLHDAPRRASDDLVKKKKRMEALQERLERLNQYTRS